MVATFFRNAVFRVGLNLVVKGTYLFAVERAVQNLLPEGQYGLYFALLGLGMLLQVVADAGLQLYNSQVLSGHRQLLGKYFPYFIGLKLALGAAFFLLLLGVGWGLGYRGEAVVLLLLAGGVQFFNSLVLYLRSNLAGLGRYAAEGWFSVADKAFMLLTVGGLLLFAPGWLTITRFAGLQLSGWALTAAGLLFALRRRVPRKRPRFRRATFLLLLKKGAPFALAVLLATAYTRTDAIMIERLLTDGAVAADHYAAGYRLLDALNTVAWMLAGLLLPMYARQWARGEDVRQLLDFSNRLLLGGGLVASVTLAAYAEPIGYWLYDFADARTAELLMWLLLSFAAQCWNYAYGALLSAAGYVGRMNWVYAGGILINVGGNLWALPRYGAAGAAAVTLATQAFVAAVQAVLAHRWLGLPWSAVAYPRLLALAIGLGTGARALLLVDGPWALELLLLGGLGGGLLLLLGLLRPAELAYLLEGRQKADESS